MLRLCRQNLAPVTGSAITSAAITLNSLLDISQGKAPVPHEQLKAFLKESVMPVMAGTELDRRGSSTDLRNYLGQLTRDAAFAATIVSARPEAGFVQSITSCIKEDHQRMRFIPQMTSAQASKTIEYLCRVGVKDEAVFPVLISRLDYTNLHEIARTMQAFAEADLHELNILVVVPLYCGNQWDVITNRAKSSSKGSCSGSSNNNADDAPEADAESPMRSSDVFEAVRVLRALSKSCRKCVEVRRTAAPHSLAAIPRDSLNLFRNNLLKFVFENGALLRGAHWVNVARALLHFPVEVNDLRQFESVCPKIAQEVRRGQLESGQLCAVNCEMVADAAIAHVFDYAENRRAILVGTAKEGNLSEGFPFDLLYRDLVKLLPLLEQSASRKAATDSEKAVANTRVTVALRNVTANAQHLYLRELVKVLQTLRRLPPSDEATAAVDVIAAQAGARLLEEPPAKILQKVTFPVVIQLAAALSALRLTRCDDFVAFVSTGATFFPRSLTVETTLAFANALANVAGNRLGMCHDAMRTLMARLVTNYEAELKEAPLVSAHPHAVTKLLRACVLLDYIPETHLLQHLLGSAEVPMKLTPEVDAAGGALVFGVTRSITHFLKQARSECVGRVGELWTQSVLCTLLPLAVSCTKSTKESGGEAAAYTAVSWRSTMEMLTAFVDPSLAHNTAEDTARRLIDAFPLCAELLMHAAATTRAQVDSLAKGAASATEVRGRLQRVSFNANCPVHFLSSLLILEYLVFQCVTQIASANAANVPTEVMEQLAFVKGTAYARLLDSPIHEGQKETPMDVVRCLFDCPAVNSSRAATTTVLLSKRDALEITTNLPFALSLIINPGPVNEYFTDRCMSLMVSDDDDDV